jgi:hypothetical protein
LPAPVLFIKRISPGCLASSSRTNFCASAMRSAVFSGPHTRSSAVHGQASPVIRSSKPNDRVYSTLTCWRCRTPEAFEGGKHQGKQSESTGQGLDDLARGAVPRLPQARQHMTPDPEADLLHYVAEFYCKMS